VDGSADGVGLGLGVGLAPGGHGGLLGTRGPLNFVELGHWMRSPVAAKVTSVPGSAGAIAARAGAGPPG